MSEVKAQIGDLLSATELKAHAKELPVQENTVIVVTVGDPEHMPEVNDIDDAVANTRRVLAASGRRCNLLVVPYWINIENVPSSAIDGRIVQILKGNGK